METLSLVCYTDENGYALFLLQFAREEAWS